MIYFGADHRGFALKEALKKSLGATGHAFEDMGNKTHDEDDDYVDFSERVAAKVVENPTENRGILICGSGHGMDIAANKHRGVRAALVWNTALARQSQEHEDTNVLVLPSDWLSENEAREIVSAWLVTSVSSDERHRRRRGKLEALEDKNFR